MRYVEIQSISRVISKREIPKRYYEGMTLLNPNTGVTSLVFEKPDGNSVRIFTKDEMKRSWLDDGVVGLRIGEHVDIIDCNRFKDIYIIDMPKLYPLNAENKKIANTIVKLVNKTRGFDFYKRIHFLEDAVESEENPTIKEILETFVNFLSNMSDDCGIDVAVRNFKQTKDGKLILLDPVCDRELMEMFISSKKKSSW